MHARSTTITADPQRMDAGIAQVRDEVMPAVRDMPGWVGLSMLCDRGSGRCIVTTSWESEEAMRATAERVRDMRERAAEAFGGGQYDVQEWEVAAMHRVRPAGDGAVARVIWSRARDTSQVDRILDAWKMTIPSRLEEVDGFCSVSLMVDRGAGRAVTTAVYADAGALERSRGPAQAMREEFTRAMDVEITDMAEMELVLAHLHVPEMV